MTTTTDPVAFFLQHAGYSYSTEVTREADQLACARQLAQAEREGAEAGLYFHWSVDRDMDSSEFDDSPNPWQLWVCLCFNDEGEVVASLGGIDFGPDKEPKDDPYRRVVQAELALEALAQ